MTKNKPTNDSVPLRFSPKSEFIAPTMEEWRAEVERQLEGIPFDKKMLTKTIEGITLKALYTASDVQGLMHIDSVPGAAPFVRGFADRPETEGGWKIAQEIGCSSPREFNQILKHDLDRGLEAVIVPIAGFSRPGGIEIDTLDDFTAAFEGIDPTQVPLYIETGVEGLCYLSLYAAFAKRARFDLKRMSGAIAFDPVGAMVTTGSSGVELSRLFDEMAVATKWTERYAPGLGTIWIHGEPYHDGGASAVWELASVLATAVTYLRELEKRGVSPDIAAAHIHISLSIGSHLFMEIARLRAARLLWNRIAEVCRISEDKRRIKFHAWTGRYNKTVYDPSTNILRDTTEVFSAAVGGADSIAVTPFDNLTGPPNEMSRRLARNTQIVLREEISLGRVIDPAGGSWYVERLTDEVARRTWHLFQRIEKEGGISEALRKGIVQAEIADLAAERDRRYAVREMVAIGINKYPIQEESQAFHAVENDSGCGSARPGSGKRPSSRAGGWEKNLKAFLPPKGSQTEEIIEKVMAAFEEGADVIEISAILHPASAKESTIRPIPRRRGTEPFERLRQAVERFRKSDQPAGVYIATIGTPGGFMERYDFTVSFFQVGGFRVIPGRETDTVTEIVSGAVASRAPVVVLCGNDESYRQSAVVIAEGIKKKRPKATIILTGRPSGNFVQQLQKSGVEFFIHRRTDLIEVLTDLARRVVGAI